MERKEVALNSKHFIDGLENTQGGIHVIIDRFGM